jgi:hypothetical protein
MRTNETRTTRYQEAAIAYVFSMKRSHNFILAAQTYRNCEIINTAALVNNTLFTKGPKTTIPRHSGALNNV